MSLYSAYAAQKGQEDTNADNRIMAMENRDWQERMSNTAHQREVADLIAAGINPMMTAMKGGASTPSGGFATAQNPVAAGITSAAQAAQASMISASVEKTKAETELIRSQIPEAAQRIATGASSAGHMDAMKDNIRQEMQNFQDRWNQIKEQIELTKEQSKSTAADVDLKQQQFHKVRPAEIAKLQAEAIKLSREAEILGLKIPEQIAEAAFWKGPDSKPAIYFRHAPKNLTSAFAGSVGAAADDLRDVPKRIREHFKRNTFRDFYKGPFK